MKILPVFLVLVAMSIMHIGLYGQASDTSICDGREAGHTFYRYTVPLVLIGAGTITMLDADGDEFVFNNIEIREERNERFGRFSSHVDDYLQHVPSVAAFALGVIGIKGKHNMREQVNLYIKSELLMLTSVYALKYSVSEARPDSDKRNSFPSGHTAQAFAAATFFSREYGYRSVWFSIGAYSAATTVAVFRLLNNRHWLSDVLAGAGIGVLSTNLVFATHKKRTGDYRRKSVLRVNPFTGGGTTGVSIVVTFCR